MPPTSPNRMTLRRSVALVWRTLRSMRTALVLLLLLALAQVPGSLLPQIPNSPERVSAYLRDHPFWGDPSNPRWHKSCLPRIK
jgi:cytochrome c biogenesis protein